MTIPSPLHDGCNAVVKETPMLFSLNLLNFKRATIMSVVRMLIILVFGLTPFNVVAQLSPGEGRQLNYRLVGFSFPARSGSDKYEVQIARGRFDQEDSFITNLVARSESDTNHVIVEVPSFGAAYTWRVVCYVHGVEKSRGVFHHFSTGYIKAVDTSMQRLRILENAKVFKDAYIIPDYSRVIYDMKGNPVWFLPDTGCFSEPPGDLKMSNRGTLTMVLGSGDAYEISYDGDILWKAPNSMGVSGDKKEVYHHQLTRLANGHYMVLGNENAFVLKKWPAGKGTSGLIKDNDTNQRANDTNYTRTHFGTIIEYDSTGAIIWSWHFLHYFKESDLFYFRELEPSYWPQKNDLLDFDMHENAFYFDERNKKIYLSFRVCSRILKIDYPSGKVDREYGEKYRKGMTPKNDGVFYGQHSCNIVEGKYLGVFNNNMRDSTCRPEVLLMTEPLGHNEQPIAAWKYTCTTGDHKVGKAALIMFKTGGNIEELPGGSMFVSMSQPYCKVFIVSREKKGLWSALPEQWDAGRKLWVPMLIYRTSMITSRQEMERLVWRAERKTQ
jgi:hypothetical protein